MKRGKEEVDGVVCDIVVMMAIKYRRLCQVAYILKNYVVASMFDFLFISSYLYKYNNIYNLQL